MALREADRLFDKLGQAVGDVHKIRGIVSQMNSILSETEGADVDDTASVLTRLRLAGFIQGWGVSEYCLLKGGPNA